MGRLAPERTNLAVFFAFFAAPRPQLRIGESRRIAEAVADRLANRLTLGLELLAGRAVLVPGLRKLVVADRLVPRLAIGILVAEDAPRHAEPFLAVIGDRDRFFVIAAL